ncbi:MAG: phytanoyl-CoA dioxygenase family protein [Oscillatoria sp. PMC 1050.18]|nr:phytanoyl-CoA dioxygenase family protein [Oscillatoria sp. PMC 1050.18]
MSLRDYHSASSEDIMQLTAVKQQWEEKGYVILSEFCDREEITQLREICDRVLAQVIQERENNGGYRDVTNIAYLSDRKYFTNDLSSLLILLEFIAHPRIISLLSGIAGEMPLFHNTQYFYQPRYTSWQGIWHRDTQFLAPEIELEKQRMHEFTGVHFRVAFEPDNCLEYVPSSQKRWDTNAELAIRKGDNPTQAEMPGKKKIELQMGDACLFHAWGIHRGTYQHNQPRRTLDIIYSWKGICHYSPPPPLCFNDSSILKKLSQDARIFYNHFISTYQQFWEKLS